MALAEHLGFKTENENEALSFLSTTEPKLVIAATKDLDLTVKPCVEKSFNNVRNFMNEHPFTARLSSLKNIPILIGNNNRECLVELEYKEKHLLNENVFRNFLVDNFNLKTVEENEIDRLITLITHFYIGDESINEDTIWSVMDFISDYKFNYDTVRSIQKFMENGAENIFHYIFSYAGSRNFMKHKLKLNESGAAHADEIGYLFDISYMQDIPTPEDQSIIDRMTAMWSNFVKYGYVYYLMAIQNFI